MEEDALDRIPYVLRKHTLKGEMEEVEEEKKLLSSSGISLSRIFAYVPNNSLGDKTLDTAISVGRRFNCELFLSYGGSPSKEAVEKLARSGLIAKTVEVSRQKLEDEIIYLAERKGFDVLILPSSFGRQNVKKISIPTENILQKSRSWVLVVK